MFYKRLEILWIDLKKRTQKTKRIVFYLQLKIANWSKYKKKSLNFLEANFSESEVQIKMGGI